MGYTNSLSKRSRIVAALSLLFFIVYCSVGVCTNLLNSTMNEPAPAMVDHSQHMMSTDTVSEHCSTESSGCQWSVNPVNDPVADAQPASGVFLYIVFASALILSLSLCLYYLGGLFSFAREQFYQRSYPRIHLQKSVFLN